MTSMAQEWNVKNTKSNLFKCGRPSVRILHTGIPNHSSSPYVITFGEKYHFGYKFTNSLKNINFRNVLLKNE